MRRGVLLLLLAAMAAAPAGCARDTVLLLPGENGAPAGAVAVLDKAGGDAAVLARGNERANLAGRRIVPRAVAPGAIRRSDLRLVEDLPPRPRTFTLNFMTDSTTLMADSEPVLAALFAEVRRRDGVDVVVVGHTDRAGPEAQNDRLSLERAEDIRRQLIARRLDPASTRAVGRGERDMAVVTADGVASPANRRVEVVVR